MTKEEFFTELETLGLFKVTNIGYNSKHNFYYLRQPHTNEDYTDQWVLGDFQENHFELYNFSCIDESGFIRVEHKSDLWNYSEIINSIRKSIIDFKKCLNEYKLKEINKDFI